MSTKKYDAVATVGTYTDKTGAEKKRYVTVGTVFENEKGLYMKLDALPLSKDWSGFISFYTPKARDGAPAPAAPQPSGDDFHSDPIPF